MTSLYDQIDTVFHPKSIAFIGVSISDPPNWTRTFWECALAFKYPGKLYPVNPRGGELNGYKVYTSVAELPDGIDYAIGTVAAGIAPDIVRKCAAKGIKAIHFCTAGFNEIGTKDEAGLQQEITEISRQTGIRIIGPNCMGIYCPESHMAFDMESSMESGHVGFISQSGGHANFTIREGSWRGIRFSKIVSYGNACDLNESDFLEYMIDDPQTKIIALYLEGVKDGKRFFHLMGKASKIKPVILLKGGYGLAGARAAATHTASLVGNDMVWDTLCRQFNIIRADNVEQLVDILVTLSFMPDPGGRNMALVGPGGGASVILTDEFEKRGFHLPALPENLRAKLAGFIRQEGNMLYNPIDISQNMLETGNILKVYRLLGGWDEIDFCIGFFRFNQLTVATLEQSLKLSKALSDRLSSFSKPIAFILEEGRLPERNKFIYEIRQGFINSNIAIYYSFAETAQALKKVVAYNERRKLRHNIPG